MNIFDPLLMYETDLKRYWNMILVKFDMKTLILSFKMPHLNGKRAKIQLASLVVENGLIARIQQGLCII